MRRWLGWIAIAWLLVVCVLALAAFGRSSSTVTLEEHTQIVAKQLRCPVCQGESVADSPSDISKAMRAIIRQRLQRGQSADEIKAYFVSRYGPWILLSPPDTGIGRFAWLAPPLLLLGGVGLLITLVLAWRERARRATVPMDDSYLERVRAELAMEGIDGP